MKNPALVHFVEWKKMEADSHPPIMKDLISWGVRDIVFHPIWGIRQQTQPGYLEIIAEQLQEAGLATPACHGFWTGTYVLGWPDEEKRLQATRNHVDFIRQLKPFNVRTYVLHLGIDRKQSSEFSWNQIRKGVDAMLPAARESGLILALENLNESVADLERLVALMDEYRSPNLGICFDTGHANCYSELGLAGTLDLLKNHIVTSHMHDNGGRADDHNPPGGGNISWPELIASLKACPRLVHAETESGDWSRESWNQFVKVWHSSPA